MFITLQRTKFHRHFLSNHNAFVQGNAAELVLAKSLKSPPSCSRERWIYSEKTICLYTRKKKQLQLLWNHKTGFPWCDTRSNRSLPGYIEVHHWILTRCALSNNYMMIYLYLLYIYVCVLFTSYICVCVLFGVIMRLTHCHGTDLKNVAKYSTTRWTDNAILWVHNLWIY